MKIKTLIVIAGPTASGKTGLAIQLANALSTEIISADSRQLYKEVEIGTARPSVQQLAEVTHHFIATHSIDADYSAGQFGRDASIVLHGLFERYDTVILCGGSGLYIKALTEGLDDMPEVPAGTREDIMTEYSEKGLAWLQKKVENLDPDYFAEVDKQNPHRLVRALELIYSTGNPIGQLRRKSKKENAYDVIKIGIELPREILYNRIDDRMDAMISAGLFEEAEKFYPLRHLNALQTVGYQEIFGYMDGLYDRDEAIRLLKRNSRRYAKRQMTWFRKDPQIHWFDGNNVENILQFVRGKIATDRAVRP